MNLYDHDFLKEKKNWPGLLSLSRWHGNQAFDQGQKKAEIAVASYLNSDTSTDPNPGVRHPHLSITLANVRPQKNFK